MSAVESILDHKAVQSEHGEEYILYLVKWLNYDVSVSTWQDEYSFKGGEALVRVVSPCSLKFSQRMLRLYQAAHDIDPIPVAVANHDPVNRNPEELWQQLWEAGHVRTKEPIDLATFMAYPEGTKRCGKINPGVCVCVCVRA